MFNTAYKLPALCAAAVLATTGVSVSATSDEANGKSVDVRYGDLNLSSAADQARLKARIARAVVRTCDQYSGSAAAKCQRLTLAEARQPMELAIAHASTKEQLAVAAPVPAPIK